MGPVPFLLPTEALISVQDPFDYARLLAAVAVLTALAALLRWRFGFGDGREEIVAIARATLQLGAVGLIIAAVLASWPLTLVFVAMMVATATYTSGKRLGVTRGALTAIPIVLGSLPTTLALLAIGLLPANPTSLIPTAGILIGNAMTTTTLAGRRSLDALVERRGEWEAGLALGLLPRDAALLVARRPARIALIPELDRTRTVGLVTLPGAFVGTLLGGATPLQASALQLIVLAGILLAQSVAVVVTVELVVRRVFVRDPLPSRRPAPA